MSDNERMTGAPDRSHVSLNEDYEIQYWATKFGVSAERIRAAVAAVGNSAEAVRKYLESQ